MRVVVMTTINPPSPRLGDFLDLGFDVVVCGDSKTPDNLWKQVPRGVQYLSLDAQREIAPELHELLGTRTYARKNFGYLWAIINGAKTVWETDDDTFVRPSVGDPIHFLSAGARYRIQYPGVWNPFEHFAKGSGLWPRGLPLGDVHSHSGAQVRRISTNQYESVGVLQLLVNREPDVDAIYRMVVSKSPVEFPASTDIVELGVGTLSPGNTQATIWLDRRGFFATYVPRWVSFRFSDILKMYVAQIFLKMGYAGFLMEQFRNEHDLMQDFESEVPMYLGVSKLAELCLKPDYSSLASVYRKLWEVGICQKIEVESASIFEELACAYSGS